VTAPINDVGLPPAHAVGPIAITVGGTGASSTAPSSISAISGGPVGMIYDQVIGAPRISIRQDRQREMAQVATPSSGEETGSTAGAGHTAICTQVT
jgi:hypothetical protein